MVTLLNSTVAFLRNGEKYLLMKRAANRTIAPGLWSGVGGHMESFEINDPLAACYREIEEESGITRDKISSLELLYIITRRSKNEIRQNYIYFGETVETDIIQTNEGLLYWIYECDLFNQKYTQTYTSMIEHYKNRGNGDKSIYVGVADNSNGKLRMNWARCEDFE